MRVRLQIEIDLDVDPASSPAAFVRQAHEAVNHLGDGHRSLLLMHGEDYVLGAEREEQRALGEWLAPQASPPAKVTLRLQQVEICMHSSPWVPGQGFLCGWC